MSVNQQHKHPTLKAAGKALAHAHHGLRHPAGSAALSKSAQRLLLTVSTLKGVQFALAYGIRRWQPFDEKFSRFTFPNSHDAFRISLLTGSLLGTAALAYSAWPAFAASADVALSRVTGPLGAAEAAALLGLSGFIDAYFIEGTILPVVNYARHPHIAAFGVSLLFGALASHAPASWHFGLVTALGHLLAVYAFYEAHNLTVPAASVALTNAALVLWWKTRHETAEAEHA